MMDEENQDENQFVEFGRMLESLRVRKGWTQEDALAHLGVTRHTYIAWKTGKRLPSDKKLKQITPTLKLSQADEDELNRLAKREPPNLHNFPFSRNPFFTGREAQLDQLGQLLKDNDSVALTQPVSISGLGGIGKTQLALEYAHRCYPDVYRTVLWVDAANETTLVSSYDKLAHLLELPDLAERDPGRSVDAVKGWLERHTNWLLIMDNADNLELARDFFPRAQQAKIHQGRILLTTRSQKIEDVVTVKLDIDKMEPDEGLLFLLRRSNRLEADADMRKAAAQVVELLGEHPLALDQAGAYIQENPFVSFAEYIDLYHEKRSELLRERDDENDGKYSYHPATVAVTFELCFEMAQKRQPLATDILRFCAFLHPDAIPEELFQHDDGFKLDTKALDKGIRSLLRYSLLKVNSKEKTCSMHRLVQAVLIDGMSHHLQKQWRERVVQALNAAFPAIDFKEWGRCERLLPHALVCATWTEDELAPTVVAAGLFHKAGSYILGRGRRSEAEPLLARVLSTYQQHLGADHLKTASALTDLALIYLGQDKYGQAEHLYQQALAIREKHLGAEHPYTVSILHELAHLYLKQGKDGQAEPLLVQAHSIMEKQLGAEHPDTTTILHSLAYLYHRQGKYGQAELLYRRVLSIWEIDLGTDHPNIAAPLFGLAGLLHNQRQHEQAEAYYQRAIIIEEQRLGATHPYLQEIKGAHANLLHSLGCDAGAATKEVND